MLGVPLLAAVAHNVGNRGTALAFGYAWEAGVWGGCVCVSDFVLQPQPTIICAPRHARRLGTRRAVCSCMLVHAAGDAHEGDRQGSKATAAGSFQQSVLGAAAHDEHDNVKGEDEPADDNERCGANVVLGARSKDACQVGQQNQH